MKSSPHQRDEAPYTTTTAAEVPDAKSKAGFAYTTAKAAARFAEAKNAHDATVAACHKAMGDALIIEKAAVAPRLWSGELPGGHPDYWRMSALECGDGLAPCSASAQGPLCCFI
jgi:hypothetical protein